jgi:hypothetical protein
MKYSTVLLCISWIPLIQLSLLPFEFFHEIEDVYIPFLISFLLSLIAVWFLLSIKNIKKNTPLYSKTCQKRRFTLAFKIKRCAVSCSIVYIYNISFAIKRAITF